VPGGNPSGESGGARKRRCPRDFELHPWLEWSATLPWYSMYICICICIHMNICICAHIDIYICIHIVYIVYIL
jgi:hypothetical protein